MCGGRTLMSSVVVAAAPSSQKFSIRPMAVRTRVILVSNGVPLVTKIRNGDLMCWYWGLSEPVIGLNF